MTSSRTSFLEILQTLAAYVAVPVALVYPFGFSGVTQRWILPGLTVAYIFGVAASLWLAWDRPAFMPYVNFGFADAISDVQQVPEESSKGPEGPFYAKEPPTQPTSDGYLSHGDGHWHFVHRGKYPAGKREYRIISLRDEEVSYSRVVDAGEKAAWLHSRGRITPPGA